MGIKLLLADDSITIQKVVGIIFASEDYDVTIVDNGDAALAKAREIGPDLLLLDAVMPGRTGYEVCEEIRHDPVLQSVPILLLTGAFEAFDEEKAKKSGADDFISKPFESQNLIDKVTRLIETGKQRAASVAPSAVAVAPSPPVPPAMEKPVPPATRPVPPPGPEVAVQEPVPSEASQFTVEVVEGTPDDDLWGAFELEEVTQDHAYDFGEVTSVNEEEPFVTEVIEEPFSFAEEPDSSFQATAFAPKPPSAGNAGFVDETDAFEVVPEEEFGGFQEETGIESVSASADQFNVFAGETEIPFSPATSAEGFEFFAEEPTNLFEPSLESEFFAEPAEPPAQRPQDLAPSVPAGGGAELQFAPDEQYVPITDSGTSFAAAPTPAFSGELTLNEEQLTALVSRISRDILEKIAWEVVPDLAENIIREEIRKIKEGL